MHRHVDLRYVCETYAHQVLGIGRDDVCLSAAKLFFAYGLGNSLLFPLSVGASAVLEPSRPNPAALRRPDRSSTASRCSSAARASGAR